MKYLFVCLAFLFVSLASFSQKKKKSISKKEGAKEELPALVHFIDRNLPKNISLWLGGRNIFGFMAEIHRPLKCFFSLEELEKEVLECK